MNTSTRLNTLTKRILTAKMTETVDDKIKKILDFPGELRTKYGIKPNPLITLQEWETYRASEMALAGDKEATRLYLDELEDRIRRNDGFMEVIFIDDQGKQINVV